VGSFGWADGQRTEDVQATMGGLDFLWVETEHFRIGSSLGTYKIPNDRDEKARLKSEFKELKKRLGRFKAPKKALDPWIRLHLYAMRAEKLYAQYVNDFGLQAMADETEGPYLGHPKKFLLLMCQRRSELGRYLRVYWKAENEFSFGAGKPDQGMFFGINAEIIEQSIEQPIDEPFDTMLHCRIAAGLTRNFVNGHRQKLFNAPIWLAYAVAHRYARGVDPRWVPAGPGSRNANKDHFEWNKRVSKLADNNFFASMNDMFGWTPDQAMNDRDHMVAWSKLCYLLDELKGDAGAFLTDVVKPIPGMTANSVEELQKRQLLALASQFDLAPSEFDEKWRKWAEDQK
ncbi:MAG: hypothetical protein AAGG01_18645, partial [Planctomycetota bacterium]